MKRLMVVFLLVLALFLTGCQWDTSTHSKAPTTQSTTTTFHTTGTTTTLDYTDFSSRLITDINAQLTQPENTYYLYFFSPYCEACNSIKNEVLPKIELLVNDTLYMVEIIYGNEVNTQIDVTHIPALVRIVDHEVDAVYEGTIEVMSVMNTLS